MSEIKRLVLSKETVRELTDEDLRLAGGGATGTCNVLPPPTGCENTGILCEYSERTCCIG